MNSDLKKLIKQTLVACCIMDDIDTLNEHLDSPSVVAEATNIFCDVADYSNSVLREALALGSSKIVVRFFELTTHVTEETMLRAARTAILHGEIDCLKEIYKRMPHARKRLLKFAVKDRELKAVEFLLQAESEPIVLDADDSTGIFINFIEYLCIDINQEPKSPEEVLRYANTVLQLLQLRKENICLLQAEPKLAEKIAPYLSDDMVMTALFEFLHNVEIENTQAFAQFLQRLCQFYDSGLSADLPFAAFHEIQETVISFLERMVDELELRVTAYEAPVIDAESTIASLNTIRRHVMQNLELHEWRGVIGSAWKSYREMVPTADACDALTRRQAYGCTHFSLS